ncbi:hypothetical protein G6L37_04905 [Agrobacterium rubi]|nr:hypothetical protein [Agrobacterium rubi]NTF24694.1 hypothetical protein [Agrobacterium rubi]
MIYMGVGGDYWPDTPRIDAVMGSRLRARGFEGTRDEAICLYGTRSKLHALEYARDEHENHLRTLLPQPGSVVSWSPGSRDLLLRFENHLRDMHWSGRFSYKGLRFETLVRDIAGDLSVAETYLSYGRQKRAIGAMLDMFLDEVEIVEHKVADEKGLFAALGDHEGELWITGPCLVTAYAPASTEDFRSAPV